MEAQEPKPVHRIKLTVEDDETKISEVTWLEIFDKSPDTVKRQVNMAVNNAISKMGFLGRTREHT